MLAVDTNVVIRYLVHDEPNQAKAADGLFDTEDIWISTTVILESAWVLEKMYGFETTALIAAVESLAGLSNVKLEQPERIRQTLDLVLDGLDFADALHLAGSSECEAFVTFDKALAKKARRLATIAVREP